jgi:hypothetical protein
VSGAPILVTGIPRSGTSWVGKMLDAGGQIVYINEPLNDRHPPGQSPGILTAPVRHRFQYISEANEEEYLEPFRETVRLRYHHLAELRRNRSPRDLMRMAKYSSSFARGRLRGRRALLDDPFAVFSAGWLARRLGCQVVAVVRHPAAVAGSRKQLGWRTDFRHFLRQPLLMEEWLHPFEHDMRALLRDPDPLAEGNLLWRMVYHVVASERNGSERIRVVRNEDLSFDPVGGYTELYRNLGLRMSEKVRTTIEQSSSGGKEGKGHTWSGLSKTGFRPLDSRANTVRWKKLLTAEEVSRVRAMTHDVAGLYYSDADWR